MIMVENGYLKEKMKIYLRRRKGGYYCYSSVKLPEPQFEGQTKGKLGNSETRGIVESTFAEYLTDYLELTKEGKSILDKLLVHKGLEMQQESQGTYKKEKHIW